MAQSLYSISHPQCVSAHKADEYKGVASQFSKVSHLMKETAKDIILNGKTEAEAKAEFEAAFDSETEYENVQTAQKEKDNAWKLLWRYADSQSRRHETLVPIAPEEITIPGLAGEPVLSDYDFAIVRGAGSDKENVWDGEIEFVKIHAGKAASQSSVKKDLAFLVGFLHARKYVSAGKTARIIVTHVSLKRSDDRGDAAKDGPHFAQNFFEDEAASGKSGSKPCTHILHAEEIYRDGAGTSDGTYDGAIAEMNQPKTKEQCSLKDCAACRYNYICNFKEPPRAFVKTKKAVSLKNIAFSEDQKKVVEWNDGVAKANAVAGCGKTTSVCMNAVAHLEAGDDPSKLLYMSFTNAAVKEMKERMHLYNEDIDTGVDDSKIYVCTFNSFGNDILKKEYTRFGFTKCPSVIDEKSIERMQIIRNIILSNPEIQGLNYASFYAKTQYELGAVWAVSEVFSVMKEKGYIKEQVDAIRVALAERKRGNIKHFPEETVEGIAALYDQYDAELRSRNEIEYADQEMMLFELLNEEPYYLEQFGYEHIIVDEFQDTSPNQMEIIRRLRACPSCRSLLVVGDDSQAIYSFRGTSPEYIINLDRYLGEPVEEIFLQENRRCTPQICEFANRINELNASRVMNKRLISTRPDGKPVEVKGFFTKEEEHQWVIDGVKAHLASGFRGQDIAILCSENAECREYASLLTQEGIQSVSLNPEPWLDNSRVRAALGFIRFLKDDTDEQSLLVYANARNRGSILELDSADIRKAMDEARADADSLKAEGIDAKAEMLKMFEALDNTDDEIYRAFLDDINRQPSLGDICSYCRDFEIFGDGMKTRRVSDYPGVVLTTCHSSKGLEWPVVYMSLSTFQSKEGNYYARCSKQYEEQRRLFFVSATRARDELYVVSQYTAFGNKKERHYNTFLEEAYSAAGKAYSIDAIEKEEHLRKLEKDRARAAQKNAERLKAAQDDYCDGTAGDAGKAKAVKKGKTVKQEAPSGQDGASGQGSQTV